VIGVPDDRWGEVVKAVVGLKPEATATEEELIAFCQERIAKYKCPQTIQIVDALPRNPTGKILKKDLVAKEWHGYERTLV
jgi:acyl-CoA synthetase (AMP-forming)/AMP-acid ligase II